jgi:hypothetical protein
MRRIPARRVARRVRIIRVVRSAQGVAVSEPGDMSSDSEFRPSSADVATAASPPQAAERSVFVYALGQVEPRFPSLAIEKEFAQSIGSADAAGLTDRQATRNALLQRSNRYLARGLCWVFTVEGIETYILIPRDPGDYELLIEAYRDEPRRDDLDAIIGIRSHIAPPDMCNGLMIPVVAFDQLYSFDRDTLIDSIPRPESVPADQADQFRSAAGDLLDQVLQLADNAGATDEHRALNYLAVRYPRIYAITDEQYRRNFSFTGVEVLPSRLSGTRAILDVIFSYRNRETDVVEKQFARVDVTEEFPFLVTKMGPYFDR